MKSQRIFRSRPAFGLSGAWTDHTNFPAAMRTATIAARRKKQVWAIDLVRPQRASLLVALIPPGKEPALNDILDSAAPWAAAA